MRRSFKRRPVSIGGAVPTSRGASIALKRGIDVVVSAALLGLLSPFLVILAGAIKLTSPGPIFYRWQVVGQNGQPFVGFKLRTMVANADALKGELMARNEVSGPIFKMRADPRITPVGQVLRTYSLDELPQLWSVLKGDMSLVGPRPPLQTEYSHFADWQKRKLTVRPGMTCLWQVSGRDAIRDFDERVRLDLEYIDNWSIGLDLTILVRTIPTVLFARGSS